MIGEISIGTIAAILTTVSFLPQVIKSFKSRSTKDISSPMYVLFVAGVFLWTLYGIMIGDYPLIISSGITFTLSATILFLKNRHG